MTVLRMCITCKQKCDRDVCELWITECALFHFKIEIISLAFKWLINVLYFYLLNSYCTQIGYKNAFAAS